MEAADYRQMAQAYLAADEYRRAADSLTALRAELADEEGALKTMKRLSVLGGYRGRYPVRDDARQLSPNAIREVRPRHERHLHVDSGADNGRSLRVDRVRPRRAHRRMALVKAL